MCVVRIRTRDEILRVAGELFTRYGFKGTSLHDIAAEVGCSKATLLYHFAHKDAILLALVEPARQALIDLVAQLAGVDDQDVRDAAIDGFIDLVLRFRREIALIYDVTAAVSAGARPSPRVRELTDALRAGLAGPVAGPRRPHRRRGFARWHRRRGPSTTSAPRVASLDRALVAVARRVLSPTGKD